MLFFDDSFYNVRQARSCDIVGVQVPNGMTPDDLKRGFDQFIRHKGGLSLSVEADRYSKPKSSRKTTVAAEKVNKSTEVPTTEANEEVEVEA